MYNIKTFILLSLSVFLGCTYPEKNIISVTRNGDPAQIDYYNEYSNPLCNHIWKLNRIWFDPEINQEEYTNHIKEVLKTNKNKIVIYIHGGLNFKFFAEKYPKKIKKRITDYHPVFIIWPSDFITTYSEHLFNNRQAITWPTFGCITFPFELVADFGRGISRTPSIWWHRINFYLKAILCYDNCCLYPDEKNAHLVNEKLNNNIQFAEIPELSDKRCLGRQIADAIFGLFELAVGLGTTPVVDSFGTASWDMMKRRTEIMFTKAMPLDSDYENLTKYCELRQGAMKIFLDQLKGRHELEITLVAHSMGTIVANKIIREWPSIKFSRIIYMGAACSIEDFSNSFKFYIEKNKKNQIKFYNYMLHPKAENLDSYFFGLFGTGSLLTQIDTYFESPVLENQLTLGRWVNVMNGINYFDDSIKNKMYLRVMPFDHNFPTKHSQFENPEFSKTGKFWTGELGAKKLNDRPEGCCLFRFFSQHFLW